MAEMQMKTVSVFALTMIIGILAGCTARPAAIAPATLSPSFGPAPATPARSPAPDYQIFPTPTETLINDCLSTGNDQIKLACYFYGAITAYEYEVAHAKYTCEAMTSIYNKSPLNYEEVQFVETYFDWGGLELEQVTEQGTLADDTWYQLRFRGVTGTIYHNLFIEYFNGKPCISLVRTVGLPIPRPQNP